MENNGPDEFFPFLRLETVLKIITGENYRLAERFCRSVEIGKPDTAIRETISASREKILIEEISSTLKEDLVRLNAKIEASVIRAGTW